MKHSGIKILDELIDLLNLKIFVNKWGNLQTDFIHNNENYNLIIEVDLSKSFYLYKTNYKNKDNFLLKIYEYNQSILLIKNLIFEIKIQKEQQSLRMKIQSNNNNKNKKVNKI